MYEHIHSAPDGFELFDGFEDGSRRSQRPVVRSLHAQAKETRRQYMAGGRRVRVFRKVLNEADLKPQLPIWHKSHQDGAAQRVSRRGFSVTVFDSDQQNVPSIVDGDEERLAELLERTVPGLFEPLKIVVGGVKRFGGNGSVHLALPLDSRQLREERRPTRNTLAPGLLINDTYLDPHQPHMSLGKVVARDERDRERVLSQLEANLRGVTPSYIELGPAKVELPDQRGW